MVYPPAIPASAAVCHRVARPARHQRERVSSAGNRECRGHPALRSRPSSVLLLSLRHSIRDLAVGLASGRAPHHGERHQHRERGSDDRAAVHGCQTAPLRLQTADESVGQKHRSIAHPPLTHHSPGNPPSLHVQHRAGASGSLPAPCRVGGLGATATRVTPTLPDERHDLVGGEIEIQPFDIQG
jgi:hypothetical protein